MRFSGLIADYLFAAASPFGQSAGGGRSLSLESYLSDPHTVWAIVLAVTFPAVVIVLGEAISRLDRRESPLGDPLRLVRNYAMPTLAIQLFLINVVGLDFDHTLVRIASTLFYLFAIAAALGIVNAVVFRSAEADSWRSKMPALFLDLSRFIFILVGTSIVLSQVWGADLGKLVTALGVGSIVIGLALQDTLGNIFAGISILFEKPYVEGDWIRYNDYLGRVVEINWRSTRLETHHGDTVIVPNGEMAKSVLMNENNRSKPRYETFDIGFSYSHPPNEVKQVLLETVASTEGVLAEPPPQVFVQGYGDSSIDYQIRFAVYDLATLPAITDNFVTRIWYSAKRHGLNIPFPIRTVYHYNGPAHDHDQDRSESIIGIGAAERILPIDVTKSGDDIRIQQFGAGETIIRRGESVDDLHLIVSGRVGIRTKSHLPPTPLSAGEIFGVQPVLRDESAAYSITALEDAMVVLISKETVLEMVATKPGFAFELEQIIENRQGEA